jgi:hypothetical protein
MPFDKMNRFFATTTRALGACLILFLTAGCIDGEFPWEKNKNNSQSVNEEPVSYVSVYQVAPGAQNADVVVDGEPINRDPLNYGQNAKYMRVVSGSKTLKLQLSGNQVEEQPVELVKDQLYSIYLVGGSQPSMLVTPGNNTSIAEGYTRINFLNLSPDAPDVNLVVDETGQVIFEGVSFKETPAFIDIPAQPSYDLTIRSSADNSILVQVPAKRLYPGWTYTVLLRGYRSPIAAQSARLAVDILWEVER